jgi:hypothetical protein
VVLVDSHSHSIGVCRLHCSPRRHHQSAGYPYSCVGPAVVSAVMTRVFTLGLLVETALILILLSVVITAIRMSSIIILLLTLLLLLVLLREIRLP